MVQWLRTKPGFALGAGLATGLLIGVGMMIGALVAVTYWTPQQPLLPDALLHASTAQGSESFALATGPVDTNMEGLFTLDFLTGELRCWMINQRTGKLGGVFHYNVTNDLQAAGSIGKNPKYLLVTGRSVFVSSGGVRRLGDTIAYVSDANTGVVCAYGVPWDRTRATAGASQEGVLVPLQKVQARRAAIRD
jgi:hypothetical protein